MRWSTTISTFWVIRVELAGGKWIEIRKTHKDKATQHYTCAHYLLLSRYIPLMSSRIFVILHSVQLRITFVLHYFYAPIFLVLVYFLSAI